MKILLISVNREKVPYPVLPIGLCAVATALEEAGHDVAFVDLCFARSPSRTVERALHEHDPDLVGIGIRNLDNCDFFVPKDFLPEAGEIVDLCRRGTTAPVVIGGSAVSIMPEAVLRYLGADYVVVGDGERTIQELAASIERGEKPRSVAGVGSFEGARFHLTPPLRAAFDDTVPRPRIYRWVDPRPYMRFEGVYPLQSKRGCSLKCVYCTYTNIEGRQYRTRSARFVVDEIQDIVERTGVRDFEFVDSTFNAPPHHAFEICRELTARKLGVRLIGNGMNPVATSPELLQAMKEAGFHSLVSTAESASDRVLDRLRKGYQRSHLENVARWTKESALPTLWIFLLGGPGEDPGTVRETLEFFHDATGPGDVAFITSGVRIYPETALETIALDEGVIRSRDELIEPRFYFSPALSQAWVREVLRRHARKDPRIITSERSQSAIVPYGLRLLSALGVKKPFWRFAPLLNRAVMRFSA